jgi:hypothetical protein
LPCEELSLECDVEFKIKIDFSERVKKNMRVIIDRKAKVIIHPKNILKILLCEG